MAVGPSVESYGGKAPGKTPVGEELECKNPEKIVGKVVSVQIGLMSSVEPLWST